VLACALGKHEKVGCRVFGQPAIRADEGRLCGREKKIAVFGLISKGFWLLEKYFRPRGTDGTTFAIGSGVNDAMNKVNEAVVMQRTVPNS